MKGSYILIMVLDQALRGLQIGRLGAYNFDPGCYLYVGSAFGSGGLPARLAHHKRRQKARPHWHNDYLRAHAELREAWTVAGPEHLQCRWCRLLAASPEFAAPVPTFGASDTGCRSHLFYLPRRPRFGTLTGLLLGGLSLERSQHLTIEIHTFEPVA